MRPKYCIAVDATVVTTTNYDTLRWVSGVRVRVRAWYVRTCAFVRACIRALVRMHGPACVCVCLCACARACVRACM